MVWSNAKCALEDIQGDKKRSVEMKRNDDEKHQHGRTESHGVTMGISTGESQGVGWDESTSITKTEKRDDLSQIVADDRPTSWSEAAPLEPRRSRDAESRESVTILIEGGGFSFNDVFPMTTRSDAAAFGRTIAKHALELADPRRRSSRRTVGE
jgi:hypothetical protein